MFKSFSLKDLLKEVLIAAIYVVLVLLFYFMSFEAIQFRIAEILLVLVFFNKKHTLGLVIGTFIANFLGQFGIIDALFGSTATLLVCIALIFLKKYWIIAIAIIPALINAIIVSVELSIVLDGWNLYFTYFWSVFLGQATVCILIGIPFKIFLEKYPELQLK